MSFVAPMFEMSRTLQKIARMIGYRLDPVAA
jgi:hypothetical protein